MDRREDPNPFEEEVNPFSVTAIYLSLDRLFLGLYFLDSLEFLYNSLHTHISSYCILILLTFLVYRVTVAKITSKLSIILIQFQLQNTLSLSVCVVKRITDFSFLKLLTYNVIIIYLFSLHSVH